MSADKITRENQKPDCEYYSKLVELLGNKILDDDKTIDRGKFAKIIFYNDEIREKVNILTFECVQKELDRILDKNKEKDFIILNFPLLYEGNFDKICDYVIAVVADEDSKIDRIMLRDMISKDDAKQRISIQKPEEFYKENADFIIDNSGKTNYLDLINSTKLVLKEINEKGK